MKAGTCALALALLLGTFVCPESASYTTEVIFSGYGWYLSDAGTHVPPQGYGLFEEVFFAYSVDSGIPSGTHSLYFMPDVTMQFRPAIPGGSPMRYVEVGSAGIDFDGQTATWESMGLTWVPGYGLSLGEHYLPDLDPGSVVGQHSWDFDGGGDDMTAQVWADRAFGGATAAQTFNSRFAMNRSLTWLSEQPIGIWFAGGLAPLLGGLPLDGLDQALDSFGPTLASWDRNHYEVSHDGSMTLTASAEPVPEPSTVLLLSGGVAALLAAGRKRSQSRS